jgi:EAL domain-containing protein (putative c-di-GMP-specific phosphodiesterase class I)
MSENVTGVEHPLVVVQPFGSLEASESVWCLVGHIDEMTGTQRFPINSMPFRVGRQAGLSLCISSPTVSGVHAEITVERDCLTVHDLDSTNGTYVNGVPVFKTASLSNNDLVQFAEVAFRVERKAASLGAPTASGDASDRAAALIHFDKLIDGQGAVPFFQPIVCFESLRVVGYEVVARSRLYGLKQPREMFLTAGHFDLQAELSRLFRSEGIRVGTQLPGEVNLFVNTHPVELAEVGLLESLRALRQMAGDRPITLEIHEAAVTDVASMRGLGAALRDLEMQLAFDDFGAGQTRLVELAEVQPDVLKFDMRLVQDIHKASPHRQQMLATLVEMVRELGIVPLAEGVECEADNLACHQLGFQLGQGYYYGRPAPVEQYIEGR